MNFLNGFWVRVAGLAAILSGLFVWRQKGISDAVGQEKAKSRVKKSIAHIKKMEKEKSDNAKAKKIEDIIGQLDDDERISRLQSFRGKHDDNNS